MTVAVQLRTSSNPVAVLPPHLPMAREDIGNYLGLTLETVSRCLSRLKSAGVLNVKNRHIRILNLDALQKVIGGGESFQSVHGVNSVH